MNHVIRHVISNVTNVRSNVTFASYIFHYDYCNQSFLQFTLKVSKEWFNQSVLIFPFKYQSQLGRAFIPTFLLFVMLIENFVCLVPIVMNLTKAHGNMLYCWLIQY